MIGCEEAFTPSESACGPAISLMAIATKGRSHMAVASKRRVEEILPRGVAVVDLANPHHPPAHLRCAADAENGPADRTADGGASGRQDNRYLGT